MNKETLKANLISILTEFVEYEDGRTAEIAAGANRRDMGRKAQIAIKVNTMIALFEKYTVDSNGIYLKREWDTQQWMREQLSSLLNQVIEKQETIDEFLNEAEQQR